MIVTYRPALGDLVHAARTWEGHHWKISSRIATAALLGFGVYCIYVSAFKGAALFIVLGIVEGFNLLPGAVFRTFIEWKTNPKFREEYQLTITPENLNFKTPTIDSTLKWTYFNNYLETSKAFILIYGKRMYSVIPKRALTTEQTEQLRKLLEDVMGNHKAG